MNVSGMWAHSLSTRDYQDLIDRGFRSCDAQAFKLSRSQKRIIERVNHFLQTGQKPKCVDRDKMAASSSGFVDHPKNSQAKLAEKPKISTNVNAKMHSEVKCSSSTPKKQPKNESELCHESASTKMNERRPEHQSQTDKPQKKKQKRIEKAKARWAAKGLDPDVEYAKTLAKRKNQVKSLEERLNPNRKGTAKHKLTLRLVKADEEDEYFEESLKQSHSCYRKYQMKIHGDEPDKPNLAQFKRFLCESPLIVKLCRKEEKNESFEKSMKVSHKLFEKYQMRIHGDTKDACDWESFEGFLVDSPLTYERTTNEEHPGLGSFHQQYYLDGVLIAVGVIDILPDCVSSVYLYYDPDYAFLTLGTYSALRELALVRELCVKQPTQKWYYMGFYIHTCPKMKYKAKFNPSYLLCGESFVWQPIKECQAKLDTKKYARFNDDLDAVDSDGGDSVTEQNYADQTLVLYRRSPQLYSLYQTQVPKTKRKDEEVLEFARLVGSKCSSRSLLLYRS